VRDASLTLALLLGLLGSCSECAEEKAETAAPITPAATAAVDAPTHDEAPAPADEPPSPYVSIPAGTVRLGSAPGTPGRSAALEADEVAIALPAFDIDRVPSPAVAKRAEARDACRADGRRLCTELEWERACDGDESADILGFERPEWTASDAGARFGDSAGQAIVRGITSGSTDARRCSARHARPETAASGEPLGFRCCAGPVPDASYPTEPARSTFEPASVEVAGMRRALAGVPELARFAEGFTFFDASELTSVFVRGRVEAVLPEGYREVTGALAWSPAPGELVWVFAGRSGKSALVGVIHPLPDGTFRHGASMILEDDPVSVLITYAPGTPRALAWTSCYGCDGEGGEIQYREDGRVVVVQL
jgi:hypothetical protein